MLDEFDSCLNTKKRDLSGIFSLRPRTELIPDRNKTTREISRRIIMDDCIYYNDDLLVTLSPDLLCEYSKINLTKIYKRWYQELQNSRKGYGIS